MTSLDQLARLLRARGLTCKVSGLGGNVQGIVVEVPNVAADQCVLVTVDDGQAEWNYDGEVEVAANYWEGTTGLTLDNAGRRFRAASLDWTSGEVLGFVRFVSEMGGEA